MGKFHLGIDMRKTPLHRDLSDVCCVNDLVVDGILSTLSRHLGCYL